MVLVLERGSETESGDRPEAHLAGGRDMVVRREEQRKRVIVKSIQKLTKNKHFCYIVTISPTK